MKEKGKGRRELLKELQELRRRVDQLEKVDAARRQVQEDLRRERDRAQRYLDIAGVVLLVMDSNANITLINRKGCEVLGYEEEEIVGRNWIDDFIPQRLRDEIRGVFKKIVAGELEPFDYYENPVICKDGRERIIAWYNTFLRDTNGEIVGTLSSGEDITELKSVRERMEKLNRLFLSLGVDLIDNIEKILQAAQDILECPRAFFCLLVRERLSVLSPAPGEEGFTVIAQPEGSIGYDLISRDSREPIVVPDLGATEYGVSDPIISRHSFRSFLGYPVIVEGRVVGCLSLFSDQVRAFSAGDVEMAGMLAQAISVEQERLEREEDLKDFIDIASHEIRHPITIIKGYALTLCELWDEMNKEEREQLVGVIDHGADRLNRLAGQLMDVSRIERGHFPMNKRKTPLRPLIEGAVREMEEAGYTNRISLALRDELCEIEADPDRLAAVLYTLLENAAKYSPAASEIDFAVEVEGEGVVVSISDRGMGVPESERERIFERFYQLEDALHHSLPGMGVGLYFASEIVEAHGGKIWHEPREGGGSIFHFTIP